MLRILSDRALQRFEDDSYEALGNVVVTYGDHAIYGERGVFSLESGEVEMEGGVRYISPEMTLYASTVRHNVRTGEFSTESARIVAENYVVLGKAMRRTGDGAITGEDAEYTTCRDCPESWSVFGRRVRITPDQYIRIRHAYFKVKDVVVLYLPYLILPIKKERESGLLFPTLSLTNREGALFQLPWYWAIDDASDMTLTPTFIARRGYGAELQYRHALGRKRWFEAETLHISDRVHRKGERTHRWFGTYEHHVSTGSRWNHHLLLNRQSDLETIRDLDFHTEDHVRGPDLGGSGFLGFRREALQLSLEGDLRRNLLHPDPEGFDRRYVQTLPRISLSTTPAPVLQSGRGPVAKALLGVDADYAVFRQRRASEGRFIRNASRLNLAPSLQVEWRAPRPLRLSTRTGLDGQDYRFPRLDRERSFSKRVVTNVTEASVSLGRTYGRAGFAAAPAPPPEAPPDPGDLVGSIPGLEPEPPRDGALEARSAHRHRQDVVLRHHFLGGERIRGNARFREQVGLPSGAGQFDSTDSIRSQEHLVTRRESLLTLPRSNTLELQWNHSVTRKSPRPGAGEGAFDRRTVLHLNVSQGYDLTDEDRRSRGRLTRLLVDAGATFGGATLAGEDHYFHDLGKHVFHISYLQEVALGHVALRHFHDTLSSPAQRTTWVELGVSPTDRYRLHASRGIDLENPKNTFESYNLLYSPDNNCWKLNLNFKREPLDQRLSVNFLMNFNENNFMGVLDG